MKDLVGTKFGQLEVVSKAPINKHGHYTWECRCDCGATVFPATGSLTSGNTTSCGCKRKSTLSAMKTHGMSCTKEYFVWQTMKARCLNPRTKRFSDYGGRGIYICDRWKNSFQAFIEDMGLCPENHCIERVNNDRGYEPANCIWTTRLKNNCNKRSTIAIHYKGETMPLKQWAQKLGLSYSSLHGRIHRLMWTPEKAFTQPIRRKKG